MSIVSALEKDHTFDTFYVRSETKQHGTASSLYQAKKFNGNDTLIKNTKALIVEDTLTTEADLKNYLFKSNSEIRDTLYSSYDIYLSEKYEIKVFQSTIERLKNNFR